MQTVKDKMERYAEKSPLLKINILINWQKILLIIQEVKQVSYEKGGRPPYDTISMFKAVLLGQWHSLSDEALEYCLACRFDFMLFCGFDDIKMPDATTLGRFRNFLIDNDLLSKLLDEINRQLEEYGLKVKNADTAIIDATIIQTAASKYNKVIEEDKDGNAVEYTLCKDIEAGWQKKYGKWKLGFKMHNMVDAQGFVNKAYGTPANESDTKNFAPLLDDLPENTTVYADKGYCSEENRQHLKERGLRNGIMDKAKKGTPLTDAQLQRNKKLTQTRYVVERTFGTIHRIFNGKRSSYFGLKKCEGQFLLKAICANLLKAANKLHCVGQLMPYYA